MLLTVTLPDDADPKTVDALEKAITDAGGEWTVGDEVPEEMPPMPPGAAGAMMQANGAQALRPPGLG